ncbi:MAG: hypothetical protein WCK77_24105 [Verrucomicrobiota bacterium]
MSLTVQINVSGSAPAAAAKLRGIMSERAGLNNRVAEDAQKFVQAYGANTSATEHKTAGTLGATPSGHLEQAYQAIQQVSDGTSATLLIPRASRLRAAFGGYALVPGPGKKYLTIPACAEAYAKRAGEFGDLFFARVGPNKTAILARDLGGGQIQTMYVLVTSANIPEARNLLPWDTLPGEATRSITAYCDEALTSALRPSPPAL